MLHGRIFVCFGRWRELYARDKDVVKPWKARPGMQVRVGGKRRCSRDGSAAPPHFSRLLPSRVGQLFRRHSQRPCQGAVESRARLVWFPAPRAATTKTPWAGKEGPSVLVNLAELFVARV